MLNRLAPPRGAYDFPRKASFRIILSKVKSDTARRSREFSPSSSFSRFTWLVQLQSPILSPPAVVRGLRYPDRLNRLTYRLPLTHENIDLPQPRDDLLW